MGKRGGKRRNRASQWMEKSTTTTEEQTVAKKPKLVDSSSIHCPSSNDASDALEVSLVGVDSSSPLPPPFSFDLAEETSKESTVVSSPLYRKEHSFPPDHAVLVKLWKTLNQHKWELSKIQQYLWALIFQSSWNIIGVAPTGSGKTLAYAIPTVLSNSAILVLVPTRELVQQVAKVFTKVCKASSYSSSNKQQQQHCHIVCIYGGANRKRQQEELEAASITGNAIVVATPGRYLDLTQSTRLVPVFSWIVLDEADQLAKDGDLGPQVDQIIETTKIPSTRLVLVSATYPEKSQERFQTWVGKEYVLVQVNHHVQQQQQQQQQLQQLPSTPMELTEASHQNDTADSPTTTPNNNNNNNAGTFSKIPSHLEQILHVCSEHKKPRKLIHTLQQIYKKCPNQRNRPLGIVFFSKIEKLKYISKLLEKEGVTGSVELHSQLPSTKDRETHLAQFACGQKPLLLATDVAARGIDVPHVQFVIQYDFPGNLQQYIHRCGRAGRSWQEKDTTNEAKPAIYSFFTRNLKPLAVDLIRLLEAHNAWVDPNLRALASDDAPKSKKHAKKTRKDDNDGEDDDDDEVDDFPELAPNRIVLKRASHVSDASSSDDESDDEKV